MDETMATRVAQLERHLRNMRMAVVVIAAFFVYEAIAPDGFHDRPRVSERIDTRELRVLDAQGQTVARLGADENGARFALSDASGNRLSADARALRLRPADGAGGARIEAGGVEVRSGDGRVARLPPDS